MRLGTVVLALLTSGAALLLIGSAVFLLLQAPNFPLFALSLAALEWAPLFILGGIVALLACGLGWRLTGWRTFFLIEGVLAGLAVLVIAGNFLRAVTTPPQLRTSIAAVQAIPAGEFSLGTFLAPAPAVAVERDVAYGSDPEQRFDVYSAGQPQAAPALIVVHGGSWRSGARNEVEASSAHWASMGFVVIDVGYRLAPEHPFPAAISDVKCALGTVRRDAARWGIDPQRIVLLGRSAGAQIALVSAYSLNAPELAPGCAVDEAPVLGVVGYYAPTILDYYTTITPGLTDGVLDAYLGGPPEQHAEAYRLARPATWISDSTPPTLLLHGSRDQYISPDNAHVLAEALEQANIPFGVAELPYANHGFDFSFAGPSNQQVQPWVDAFLRNVAGLDAP